MDLKIFKVIEIILKSYAKQPVHRLLDHFLRLRIITKVCPSAFQKIAADVQLPPAETAVFSSKNKENKGKEIVCVIIDHPLCLPLTSKIIQKVDGSVVIHEKSQVNNILGIKMSQIDCQGAKAIFFRTVSVELQEMRELLDTYLSVCEVFMGHLHLVVSCFQFGFNVQLDVEIDHVQGDEFADFRENGYFRVLEQRGSKVTLQELSDIGSIERQSWGESLIFGSGMDCLIVWITKDYFPLLGYAPSFRMPGKKSNYVGTFSESKLGVKFFVRKQFTKSKLEDLNPTTLILNFRVSWNEEVEKAVAEVFHKKASEYLRRVQFERDSSNLSGNIQMCDRVCQILDIPTAVLLKKLMS